MLMKKLYYRQMSFVDSSIHGCIIESTARDGISSFFEQSLDNVIIANIAPRLECIAEIPSLEIDVNTSIE
jgi:hypothetical protein